jgi:hypothetical protein
MSAAARNEEFRALGPNGENAQITLRRHGSLIYNTRLIDGVSCHANPADHPSIPNSSYLTADCGYDVVVVLAFVVGAVAVGAAACLTDG